jgi:hypothetical protein
MEEGERERVVPGQSLTEGDWESDFNRSCASWNRVHCAHRKDNRGPGLWRA